MRRFLKVRLITSIMQFITAVPAYASEAAHGEHVGIGWPFVFKLINFAIFAFLLYKVAAKKIPAVLAKRREEVAAALDQAKAREAEAHALLKEYDRKLSDLGELMQKMLNEARTQAENEKQRLIAQAKQEAEEIVRSAQRSAGNMEQRLAREMRQLAVREALMQAESKARAMFSGNQADDKQRDMVQGFLSEVKSLEGN